MTHLERNEFLKRQDVCEAVKLKNKSFLCDQEDPESESKMSSYSSEYSMDSVNSINENIYNARKLAKSPKYRLRKIFKPILKMLHKGKKTNKHLCKCQSFDSYDYAADNDSNETLETRILDEIRDAGDNSAVYVYGDEDRLLPVDRQQTFVPVHFARTDAGTFFWTTFGNSNDEVYDDTQQLPQLHLNRFDRWVQA